ncbi:M60 family metallopeptidase, partial [Arachidicoccus sp.]|uniref:M60 family metallopeptidase n=1 Tax=Arachidicoccus sp. TaxID=1872624 RepID=UPI003D2061E6
MKMHKSKALLKTSSALFGLIMIVVLTISSCKKSRFNVPDGYTVDSLKGADVNVDTTDTKPDFSFLSQARIFPGVVNSSEKRITDTSITMDLNYNDIRNSLRISVVPQPWKPTGLYAPAGEPITIILPANAVGITAQIGCWTDNISNKSPRKREPIIYTVKKLFPGENHIRGPFGGQIFLIPEIPLQNPITFHVSGACREPDFHLGVTDPIQWKQEIMTTSVPWFDFDSKHMAFSLPTKVMVNYLQSHPNLDLNEASQAWDDIINNDYDKWEGLSDTAADKIDQPTNLPWRVVLDIQPSAGYGHNGYPVVATDDNEWFNAAFTGGDTTGNLWGTLHELGHNNQQGQYWDWSTLGETTNNLHSFKRANRMGIQNLVTLHPAFAGGASSAQAKALAYVLGSGAKNFDVDQAINDPFERMIPFLQIFDKLQSADGTKSGWDFWPFLYRRARHALRPSNNDIDKHDFFYEALCDYTGLDCKPFFDAWGIQLSAQATSTISQEYPNRLKDNIWLYDPIS